ncbi:MAG: hypothetical protein JNK12_23515 [Acidimicrobiales bacterium]|nr:hypothetical protein [Acidimicrobiales bacterium]
MRRSTSGVLLCGALLLAAACGSGVDGGDDPGGGAGGSDGTSGIEGALSVVPLTDGATDFVVVNDIAAAADAAGVTAPGADADDLALGDYFSTISGLEDSPVAVAPAELVQQTAIEDDAWRTELGWAPVDLTGDVSAGQPPNHLQAFFADFDAAEIDEAVHSDPTWSDQLVEVEYDGLTYYSWGEDGSIDPEGLSTVRRLGESARLFVDEEAGLAYWTRTTEGMEQALATFAGDAPSLADDPELGPMAAALDDLGAYSAVLTADAELFAGGGELEPYDAVASGAAVVDGGPRLLLVYANPDEATAQANADALAALVADGESSANGRPWSDALGAGEIEVDGTLVTATFPTEDARLWNGIFLQRDSLLTFD